MKKADLKNFMIVCNGLDEMFIVFKGKTDEWLMVRDLDEFEEEEYYEEYGDDAEPTLSSYESEEFNDDLVHVDKPPFSIIEVYDTLPIEPPFNLCVKELYEKYKPKLLWKREPSTLSISKLQSFKTTEEMKSYIDSIVPPYLTVE